MRPSMIPPPSSVALIKTADAWGDSGKAITIHANRDAPILARV